MAFIERIAAAWAVLVEILGPTSPTGDPGEDPGWWDRPGVPSASPGHRPASNPGNIG